MNLKQAHYMLTIAQEGGITAAARKLYISQPSLSQMLRQVEEEAGLPLFDRSVSPFRLTYAGERYLHAAQVMLRTNEMLENELREIRQEDSGRLRLGISMQRSAQILPLVLPVFTRAYPKVKLELVEAGSARQEELVRQGQVDLALAATDSTCPDLTYQLIEREIIGVLCGRGSPLSARLPGGTPISLDQLSKERFVVLKHGHSLRVVQDALFRANGLRPDVVLETDSLETARQVALHCGWCMLCSNIYASSGAPGSFYPLKDYDNARHFYACYRSERSLTRYMRDFIAIVTRSLAASREGTSAP